MNLNGINFRFSVVTALALFVALLHGCIADPAFKVILAEGINYKESKDALTFISPDVGFAGGDKYSPDTPPFGEGWGNRDYQDAMIWKTLDGGHTWQANKLDSGSVRAIFYKDEYLFAIVNSRGSSKIYRSIDIGETWQLLSAVNDVSIYSFYAKDPDNLYYYSHYDDSILMMSDDGGISWHSTGCKPKGIGIRTIFFTEEWAYYVMGDFSNSPFMIRRNLTTHENDTIVLPPGRVYETGQNEMIVLKHEQSIEVYKIDGVDLTLKSKIKAPKVRYDPQFIDNKGDRVFLYMVIRDGYLFGSQEVLLFSKTGGSSWTEIKLGLASISPYYSTINTMLLNDNYYLWFLASPTTLGIVVK